MRTPLPARDRCPPLSKSGRLSVADNVVTLETFGPESHSTYHGSESVAFEGGWVDPWSGECDWGPRPAAIVAPGLAAAGHGLHLECGLGTLGTDWETPSTIFAEVSSTR